MHQPDAARRTLVITCIATAMLMLDIAVINSALPRVAIDLHSGMAGVQWVIDAYTVALAATVLTAGSIADRIGRRTAFVAGLVLFTSSSLGCALAPTIGALDGFRAVQGVGGAIMFATSLALLGDAFPDPTARAKALAMYGATIGASFAVGPLVGGALTSGFGWPSIFLVNLPIGIACVWGARGIPDSRDPNPRAADPLGQVLLGGGLFALVLALLRGNEDGWGSGAIVFELVAAGVLLTAFLVSQHRGRSPMLPLTLFADRTFTGAQVAAFAMSSSMFAIFMYVTIYLQSVLGLSPVQAGLVYLPGTIAMFFVSGATAAMQNKVSARTLVIIGLALTAVGLAYSLKAGADSHWYALLPGLLVSFIGTGIFNPALSGLVLGSGPAGQSGLAAGVNDTFRQAGIAVGIAALGTFIPVAATGRAYVHGLHVALLVAAGVAAAGAVITAVLVPAMRVQRPVESADASADPVSVGAL